MIEHEHLRMSEDTLGGPTLRPGAEGSPGRIDRYELVGKLGGGAFGTVYLARDTVARIEVAVKGLPPIIRHDAEELDRIRDNFALVSRLHHPRIAPALHLHQVTSADYADEETRRALRVSAGDYLVVMAFAPGVTLSQWRRQFPGRRVPLPQALAVCRQIAEGLDYAHRQRIVHRDIKPANVMIETLDAGSGGSDAVDGGLAVRILDFGLAAEIRSSMSRVSNEAGRTSGTRPYMAPEQWAGQRQTAATDQYALAAMFHELVSGAPPFAGAFDTGDPIIMERAVASREPEPLDALPETCNRALRKALSKKPDDRFPTCIALVAALDGGGNAPAVPPCPPAEMPPLPPPLPERVESSATAGSDSNPALRQPGEERQFEIAPGLRMTFCWIPETTSAAWKRISGGKDTFTMGSPPDEQGRSSDETPHEVRLTQGFWMGKCPVTQAQWQAVMWTSPSEFQKRVRTGFLSSRKEILPDHPVESVSWMDTQSFLTNLADRNCRLPTEAEWEYACRAGTTGAYSGGLAWYKDNSGNTTHPVGQKSPNAWGLHDMHGNVCEWCADWYGGYSAGLAVDPPGPSSGVYRVCRGGSWCDDARLCRSAIRGRYGPGMVNRTLGFRLARDAP